jgi:S1-C subfamily serine protease
MAQTPNVLELSRTSAVALVSKSRNSKGSGALVGDRHLLTCFHVVAALSVQGSTVNWSIHPDLEAVLPSGEIISGTVVSVPTQADATPLTRDFAFVELKSMPAKSFAKVELSSSTQSPTVGDDVVFSGYPLATPGMVTNRGMVSGFDDSSSVILIQAPINKGNSGGALLNGQGQVIGLVSMREGGISQGLSELRVYIDKTSSQGNVKLLGVDPLQATRAIIDTLDQYISTGIGYARSVKFARDYAGKHPEVLK